MKRILSAFLCAIIILSPFFQTVNASASAPENEAQWPDGPGVNADSAIVMEASTGLILYEKNMDDRHYPASITKIMTALVAIENSNLGDVVTFSKNAVFDVDLDSSRIGIDVGEKLTMQQCLYGILLESANEVAYAVAEHVSGSVEAFVEQMNRKAKELGCTNTHFVNPHGLHDDDHYTSSHDMALITQAAMKNATFRKIFASRTYQIPPTNLQSETRYLRNHHKFVLQEGHVYDDCIGGKTGYTSKSRFTLVSVAKRGDLELICVIMRDDTSAHQYSDTKELLDYAFDNFTIYSVADLEATQVLNESPMFTRYNPLLSKSETPIEIDKKGFLILPNSASFQDAKREIEFYSSPASATANAGMAGAAAKTGMTASTDTVVTSDTDAAADTSSSGAATDTDTPAQSNTTEKTSSADSTPQATVIGKISYSYGGKYVGGSDILYQSDDTQRLVLSETVKNNPTAGPRETQPEQSDKSLRPFILGGIAGLFVLIVFLYYMLVERPRLRRRKAYYKKRARHRSYMDDDYLNL